MILAPLSSALRRCSEKKQLRVFPSRKKKTGGHPPDDEEEDEEEVVEVEEEDHHGGSSSSSSLTVSPHFPAIRARSEGGIEAFRPGRKEHTRAWNRVLGGKKPARLLGRVSVSTPDVSREEDEAWTTTKKGRANSCATLFIDSTLAVPDVSVTIDCVALDLEARLFAEPRGEPRGLGRELCALEDVREVPCGRIDLGRFLASVYERAQCREETIVASLALVDRLLKKKKEALELTAWTWRPIVFTAMLLASKVCDDESPMNAEWHNLCPEFTVAHINAMEVAFLRGLEFQVGVSARAYAEYYFHLRTLAARHRLIDPAAAVLDPHLLQRIIIATKHRRGSCTTTAVPPPAHTHKKGIQPPPQAPDTPHNNHHNRRATVGGCCQASSLVVYKHRPKRPSLEDIVDMAPGQPPEPNKAPPTLPPIGPFDRKC